MGMISIFVNNIILLVFILSSSTIVLDHVHLCTLKRLIDDDDDNEVCAMILIIIIKIDSIIKIVIKIV